MPCDRAPGTGDTVSGPFINWAENVTTNPQQIFQPTTLDELVAIVKQAEADNLSVHAVGSGWSFTDVMTATGYMVRTDNLNGVPEPKINPPAGFAAPPLGYGSSNVLTPQVPRKPLATLSETMTNTPYPNDPVFGALTPAAHQRNLCHVEAGIKIADLYTFLEGIPSGITTPDGLWHGYAVKTLGGSGGQAITGAITTSTHGGDDHDSNGQPIRPLPEMVQGIRMVGADGVEYFVQRSSTRAIIHPGLLAQLDPCLAGPGQIITSEDFLNAVVVSMGRMGVIYSVVLEVLPQYFLAETVTQGRWNQVIPTITDLREANRFLQILILPYATYEQSQIGNNTTASTPFVTPDPSGGAWVYFQGTNDNKLWKVRDDGSQQSQIGDNTTASTPFVVPDPNGGAWVYFQGTNDNKLWKVRDDGSQQSQIGDNTTASTPFVVPDPNGGAWVYFQGTNDNKLWKVRDDGSQQSQIGDNTTASTPFVVPDPNGGAWVYFQGTNDNKLWKVRDDGSQQSQIGDNTTASTPFVTPDGWVCFQGTNDNKLWKVRDDGSQQSQIGDNTTASTPFVVPDPNGGAWVYFQGTNDNKLWKVRDDGSQQSQIGNNTTASTPFVTPDGWVYFQGTDTSLFRGPGTLWKIRTDDDRTCSTTTRNEVEAANFTPSNPFPSLGSRIFTFACEEPPAALAAQIAAIVRGLEAFVAGGSILLGIPIVGPLLAGLDIAAAITLIALLTPLLDSSATIGDYLATAVNILDQLGQISFTESLVNSILGSLGPQSGSVRQDVSFRIMDGYDYKGSCFKALSLEVGFNADDTAYLDYISAVFNLINNFSAQNILTGAYISLRYCAGSSALLAIEQWPHTVCIEISALAHLNGEQQVLSAFENETANHIGRDGRPPTVHWGQLNARSPGQVDAAFPEINTWRSVLARLTMNGKPSTFDNDFCENHGLETLGVKPAATGSDQSYLAPLLFQRPRTDLSYLLPLLST